MSNWTQSDSHHAPRAAPRTESCLGVRAENRGAAGAIPVPADPAAGGRSARQKQAPPSAPQPLAGAEPQRAAVTPGDVLGDRQPSPTPEPRSWLRAASSRVKGFSASSRRSAGIPGPSSSTVISHGPLGDPDADLGPAGIAQRVADQVLDAPGPPRRGAAARCPRPSPRPAGRRIPSRPASSTTWRTSTAGSVATGSSSASPRA